MEESMKKGTIYVFRNPMFRDDTICKVGYTDRHVQERLSEANKGTYSLPEWKVELAKEVNTASINEKNIHKVLMALNMRMYPNKEFFNAQCDVIKSIFDLIPGTYYTLNDPLPSEKMVDNDINELVRNIEQNEESEESEEFEEFEESSRSDKRTMRDYLVPNMKIRHRSGKTDTDEWIGHYDYDNNVIIYNGKTYNSPTAFAKQHTAEITGSTGNRSGWNECSGLTQDGTWKVLKKLPKLPSHT